MDSIEVSIPVDAETAAALAADPRRREAAGRLVQMLVHPEGRYDPLLATMEQIGREAADAGLTQEIIEAELAAHKAERVR